IDVKQYNGNTTFDVPSSTRAIAIFVQGTSAGSDPTLPPSMFKVKDNGDLTLQSIQIQYANINKPGTPCDSKWDPADAADESSLLYLQQRFHDSYYECGLDVDAVGCETFADWMRRGPFYYFSFDRDMSNHATVAQISVTFANNSMSTNANIFCCSLKRRTVQYNTQNGRIVSCVSADAPPKQTNNYF